MVAASSARFEDAEIRRRWVHLYDRVANGEMPPPDAHRPEASEQKAFLNLVADEMNRLADVTARMDTDVVAVYTDRFYGPGGGNEITDADIAAEGYDWNANDLANGMNLCNQLVNFRDNAPVTQGDYGQIMNTLRGLS